MVQGIEVDHHQTSPNLETLSVESATYRITGVGDENINRPMRCARCGKTSVDAIPVSNIGGHRDRTGKGGSNSAKRLNSTAKQRYMRPARRQLARDRRSDAGTATGDHRMSRQEIQSRSHYALYFKPKCIISVATSLDKIILKIDAGTPCAGNEDSTSLPA